MVLKTWKKKRKKVEEEPTKRERKKKKKKGGGTEMVEEKKNGYDMELKIQRKRESWRGFKFFFFGEMGVALFLALVLGEIHGVL